MKLTSYQKLKKENERLKYFLIGALEEANDGDPKKRMKAILKRIKREIEDLEDEA